jgi:hypothetical protein
MLVFPEDAAARACEADAAVLVLGAAVVVVVIPVISVDRT